MLLLYIAAAPALFDLKVFALLDEIGFDAKKNNANPGRSLFRIPLAALDTISLFRADETVTQPDFHFSQKPFDVFFHSAIIIGNFSEMLKSRFRHAEKAVLANPAIWDLSGFLQNSGIWW